MGRRRRAIRFLAATVAFAVALLLLKLVAVRFVGAGPWLEWGVVAILALGGIGLGRLYDLRASRAAAIVLAVGLFALPNVLLTPWPYEVAFAADGLPIPPGGVLESKGSGGSMVCFDQCSFASRTWRFPAGTDVNATTRALATALREDRWRVDTERIPGPNDPGTAWIPYGWVHATRPGLRLNAEVHPCADGAWAALEPCPTAASRPVEVQVYLEGD